MQNSIKVILASIFALLAGSGFLAAGGRAITRGFFYVSKHSAVAVRQQESPVYFYAFVAFMLLCGVLLLGVGVAIFFSRGELRNDVISFVDSALIRRPSPRWWLVALTVIVVALLGFVSLLLYEFSSQSAV